MNPKDAIEKLMTKQAQMMAEAKAMAMRADKLKRIVDFQDNPYDGWLLVSLVALCLWQLLKVLCDSQSHTKRSG